MKSYSLGIFLVVVVAVAVLGAGVYIYAGSPSKKDSVMENGHNKDKKSKKKKDSKRGENKGKQISGLQNATCVGGRMVELASWTMPDELLEISSIAWLGEEKIAAVQDNAGTIFIYNLATKKVEKRINFGSTGDYEGLTYADGHYFVMRSDANMFEVDPSGKLIKQYDLPLTENDNIEPFFYDAPNNRMLLGQKDGPKGSTTKSFFAIDLNGRKFIDKPVYTINLSDPIVSCNDQNENDKEKKGRKSGKKKGKSSGAEIRPSEIVIDPKTKDILIADGPNHRVLMLSPAGKPKYYLSLDSKLFPQVEGMLYTPTGELYLSTEGIKGKMPAKISKMQIKLQ